MKVTVDESGSIVLGEVYNGVFMETNDKTRIAVCMRDDTFEINILPDGEDEGNWWRVDMQKGTIIRMV